MSAESAEVFGRAVAASANGVKPAPDRTEIERFLSAMYTPADIVELRALHKGKKRTDAGYFDGDHRDKLVEEAVRLNQNGAAVYVTMNPLNPQILARCANRVEQYAQSTATDANITRRSWFLLDLDPQRPKDTSATDEQVQAALARGRQIYAFLRDRHWPSPLVAESGNGVHLFYRIDLPNDEPSRDLLKRCLEALAGKFDDELIKVDTAVFNASRIVKLHGTVANKGDNVPIAPWRVSHLTSVPTEVGTVSKEQLLALAGSTEQKPAPLNLPRSTGAWQESDVERFLVRGGIEFSSPEPHEGATRWKLKVCPFNADHGFGESAVFLASNGRLGFECRHNSCQDKHWRDLRDFIDGPRESRSRDAATQKASTSAVEIELRPLPKALPDVPPFDVDLLPTSVRAWVEDCADGLQAPLDFPAVGAIAGLAGVIGRQVGIAPKQRENWVERPIIWAGIVGRPSTSKSPSLRPVQTMLTRLETEASKDYYDRIAEWEAQKLVAEAAKDNAKKSARKLLEANRGADAVEQAAAALRQQGEEPKPPRIVVNDSSIEKLGEVLNANPRGLIQFRDELAGWLASLDREGREGDRAFWLECYGGTGSFKFDRIGRGTVSIEACAVSILGGIQPGKLGEYVRGAVRGGFADDGLIQRFGLIVYPDTPKSWRYVDREPNHAAQTRTWDLFQRLNQIDVTALGAERNDFVDVPFLRYAPDAQELFVEWQTSLMQSLRAGAEPSFLESHFAKYPALVSRLALILHLADYGVGPVSATALAKALDWSEYLKAHARRVYAPITDNGVTAAHAILAKRTELEKPFTAREVYTKGWTGLSERECVFGGLDLLAEYGYLLELREESKAGGRPTRRYSWRDGV